MYIYEGDEQIYANNQGYENCLGVFGDAGTQGWHVGARKGDLTTSFNGEISNLFFASPAPSLDDIVRIHAAATRDDAELGKIAVMQEPADVHSNNYFSVPLNKNRMSNITALLSEATYNDNPFPHCIINNFLTEDACHNVHREVCKLRLRDANQAFTNVLSANEYNKFAFDNINSMAPCLKNVFQELVSQPFVTQLEELINIKGLIAEDLNLRGAGVHMIANGGRLGLHTDFNTYIHPVHGRLDRRINLLLYLNKDWQEEYGGDLLLVDTDTNNITRISPTLNTCVIFSTTNKSVHGHPEPLAVPPNVRRQSIALYYYTKSPQSNVDFEGDAPHSTLWHTI